MKLFHFDKKKGLSADCWIHSRKGYKMNTVS